MSQVVIGTHRSLVNRAPEMIEILSKWHLNGETQAAVDSWMAINDASKGDAALYFLVNFEVNTRLQRLEPSSSMVAA